MRKVFTILFIVAFASGCIDREQATPKEQNPLFSLSRAISLDRLDTKIDLQKIGIYKPTKVIKKDSLLIVLDLEGLNKITIYKQDGTLIGKYLPTGLGEQNGLYILTMNLDEKGILSAYDFGNSRMVEFDMNQLGQPGFGPVFTPVPTDQRHLCAAKWGSTLVATGMFDKRYALLENGQETFFLDYPSIPTYRNTNNTQKSMLFASNIIKIKPDGTKFVCANMQSGIIDLCSLIPCNTITRITEQNLYSPKATVKSTRRKPVVYSTDNLFGFCDLEVTDDYIYALYSGRSYNKYKDQIGYGERIVVFDWEGNHVHTYLLGNPFTSISFCKEENAIYGLTNHPNSVLIKYALD